MNELIIFSITIRIWKSLIIKKKEDSLENYFINFRNNIIGIDHHSRTPYGLLKIVYMDYSASGRLYQPIEDKLVNLIGPYVANLNDSTVYGKAMIRSINISKNIIMKHVNANKNDLLITDGSGMTCVINKFQRILGLKVPFHMKDKLNTPTNNRPIVFISHMEHVSNQNSWLDTICDVEIIPCDKNGLISTNNLIILCEKYKTRKLKIVSITSCSNLTGLISPYYEISRIIHSYNGLCFVDFACSGPYVNIDMHPINEEERLDAIFFSPHKFLGGPSSSGVLIFSVNLLDNISFINPLGDHNVEKGIKSEEETGTPAFIQLMRISLCIQLKDAMCVDNIIMRENILINYCISELNAVDNINIFMNSLELKRIGVISFYIDNLSYSLGMMILNDRFGIQLRGGPNGGIGTYTNYLMNKQNNNEGYLRISIHPTNTTEEIQFVCNSIKLLALNHKEWSLDYYYDIYKMKFFHNYINDLETSIVNNWFS